jgi:hypothetical protein
MKFKIFHGIKINARETKHAFCNRDKHLDAVFYLAASTVPERERSVGANQAPRRARRPPTNYPL